MTVLRLVDGDSLARRAGAIPGDCIVCVNGEGYRRFPPDYPDKELEHLNGEPEELTEEQVLLRSETLTAFAVGEHYNTILQIIKDIKAASDPENPLILQLERHGWDAKAHSLLRFLTSTNFDVVDAMGMLEQHEQWREAFFPIDLTAHSLQQTIALGAISEVCIDVDAPTIYINYAKVLNATFMDESTKKHLMLVDFAAVKKWPKVEDAVTTMIMYMELLLGRAPDPTKPKVCHLIDLSSLKVTKDLNVDLIRAIYETLEAQYPETLSKIILYPIDAKLVKHKVSGLYKPTESFILKSLLEGIVSKKTQDKFVITDSLDVVCEELGWGSKEAVEDAGGLEGFVFHHNNLAKEYMLLDAEDIAPPLGTKFTI